MSGKRMLATAFSTLLTPGIVLVAGGDARWLEAWLFGIWFITYCTVVVVWLARNNPALLDERFRRPGTGGQSAADRAIVLAIMLGFYGWNVLMPLDARRLHLSPPFPLAVEAFGALLLAVASFFLMRAFTDNSFLSPLVRHQAEREQHVIDTGVYAIVRHPMYLGAVALFLGAPLFLGSLYGLIVGGALSGVLVLRIFVEEAMLLRDLPGYEAYRHKVRHRLVPGVF